MKINLLIADSDSVYLERVSKYIQEKHTQFELYSFSSAEYLDEYLKAPNVKVDILLCSDDLFSPTVQGADAAVKAVLSDGTYDAYTEYEHINKYQKAENIITAIQIKYAEITGRTDSLAGKPKDSRVVGVYSPVGGSGKTTLAVAVGKALAEQNRKVLYLNYECICSTADFFMTNNSGMSEVYLAAMSSNTNAGLKVIANKVNDSVTGVDFVGCAESMLEFNELSADNLANIIKQTDELNEFDYIIVDFDSTLSADKFKLLSICDKIIMPFTLSPLSVTKMNCLMKEREMHGEVGDIVSKAVFVANMAENAPLPNTLCFPANTPIYRVDKNAAFMELRNIASRKCGAILGEITAALE